MPTKFQNQTNALVFFNVEIFAYTSTIYGLPHLIKLFVMILRAYFASKNGLINLIYHMR